MSGKPWAVLVWVLLTLLPAACSAPAPEPDQQLTALAEEGQRAALAAAPNLYTIELPAGDVGSINVGWFANGASQRYDPKTWLDDGDDTDPEPDDYDGVRFVGKGIDKTHVRCDSWDGATVCVIRHAGIVQLEQLTVHAGYDRASNFGEQNLGKKLVPKFHVRLIDTKWIADPPTTGTRPKWLVFGYNLDLTAIRCRFVGKQAVEHDIYVHGLADAGMLILHCVFDSAGAECVKLRSDATETAPVVGHVPRVVIADCTFADWFQDWSWRGGAGIVIQGGAADVLVQRCFFRAGRATANVSANARSHCIMVSSEADSYEVGTGRVGVGAGNGFVVVRDCVLSARSEYGWNNAILAVTRNSGSQLAAKGALIENSGLWGPKLVVRLGAMPAGMAAVRGCNTPKIKAASERLGVDTTYEALIPLSNRLAKASEGIVQ